MEKEIKKIKEMVAESLTIDESDVTMSAKLIDNLGADSLGMADMLISIEAEFDIEVSDKEAVGIVTVADLVRIVGSKIERT